MGEVHRAHDAKLKRDIAIKILPEALAVDPVAAACISCQPSPDKGEA